MKASKIGRPPKEETPYKVIIHKNGGRRYASTKIVVSLAGSKKVYRHKHWGYIDDKNKFHPNDAFVLTPAAERDKLIFPGGIDLSEIAGVTSVNNATVIYQPGDKDRQYGATWFMDKVAEVTGIKEDLKTVFHYNSEEGKDEKDKELKEKTEVLVNEILTLAYFPYLENMAYCHLEDWQKEVYTPTQVTLTPKRITLATKAITTQNREDLFQCRSSRVDNDELCAVDSTSISTYGCHLVDIKFGKNKEKLPLAQTVEVVVYSLTSHLPIFYIELPGNMPDSRTMRMILERLAKAGFKKLIIITDRGYESLKNIQLYLSQDQKVLTSVKTGQGDVLKRIRKIDLSTGVPSGMEYDVDSELFYAQYTSSYSFNNDKGEKIKADLKINLYFSIMRRAQCLQNLTNEINTQINKAQEIIKNKEKVKLTLAKELDYLNLEIKDKELKGFSVNEKKRKKSLETAGFFASKTTGLNYNPLEAMHKYSLRDEQEKCFQKQKSQLHQDRLRCWTEPTKHGRMFITFISLILTSYIAYVWSQNEYLRKKFRTSEDIVRSFRTIRCFERDGRIVFITPFVGDQVEICKAFGFEIPKNCAPASYHYPTSNDDK